ncbi:MAG: hypothetical protein HYY60_01400 [Parcubacteria group bacterium]|nr:hypothetical protein [Parcubacteria group bacterium]
MGAHTQRERRGNSLPPREPRKYRQGQIVSRDGPPLGDMVASALVFRFSLQGTLEILGVEDWDPRKSKRRFVNGVHSPFCLCLPNGRQQTDKKSGEKEPPHFVARKEAQEEAGISLPYDELLPVLAVRRVARGETGRDSFDKERPNDGQIIYFDHFVFACFGENIMPGTPREDNIKNPAWHSVKEVLDPQVNQLWSFDHVTLIAATLTILGDMCRRWSRGEWTPEVSRNTREESLGSLFFPRLAVPLQKSPDALSAMTRFAAHGDSGRDFHDGLLDAVASRQMGSREEQREQAEWYLGMKHERVAGELEARVIAFQSDVDRAREYLRRAEQRAEFQSRTPAEASRKAKVVEEAHCILEGKEERLRRTKGALLSSYGKFVHGSFRTLGSARVYLETWREIENEKTLRVAPRATPARD